MTDHRGVADLSARRRAREAAQEAEAEAALEANAAAEGFDLPTYKLVIERLRKATEQWPIEKDPGGLRAVEAVDLDE